IGNYRADHNLACGGMIFYPRLRNGPPPPRHPGHPPALTRLDGAWVRLRQEFVVLMNLVLPVGSVGAVNVGVLSELVGAGLALLVAGGIWTMRMQASHGLRLRRVRCPRGAVWRVIEGLPWLLLFAALAMLSIEGLVPPEVETDAWAYHLGAPKVYLD